MNPGEIMYRLPGRFDGFRPGAHRGKHTGEGYLFQHLAPFLCYPDPRRLDLRASLADPFGNLTVRLREQPTTLKVFALLDLSASMAFGNGCPKAVVMADFVEALAAAAHRNGDALGIYGAAERILPEFSFGATRWPGSARRLAARLRRGQPRGVGSQGLLAAARRLPARASLVLVLSDFHMPLTAIQALLDALAGHWLVPVVIWDERETLPSPPGLARLVDAEAGHERLLLIRPALRERLIANLAQRREHLNALFRRHGRRPLLLDRGFSAAAVNRYFLAGT